MIVNEQDKERKLDEFLRFNERRVLPNAGKVSKQASEEHAKAERWKALYENASDQRRDLRAEMRKQGPHVVRHSRDGTFSALCARCGCVVTQRFETRPEALRRVVKGVPGPKRVVVEEGPMSNQRTRYHGHTFSTVPFLYCSREQRSLRPSLPAGRGLPRHRDARLHDLP